MSHDIINLNSRRAFLKAMGLFSTSVIIAGNINSAEALTEGRTNVKTISLAECLAMKPVEMAVSSDLVQRSWRDLQRQIDTIKNSDLRRLIKTIYDDPDPLVVRRLDKDSRRQLWQTLSSKGYTGQSENDFLPPLPEQNASAIPFYAAPGSGYQSHHAYPGGLVTHVATNVQITDAIIDNYHRVYGYDVDRDIALGAQLLHDLHKPYVFQWNADGSSRTEQTLAGTGEHHILSAAELIFRGVSPELVIAMAAAHTSPSTEEDEHTIASWLDAAAAIAGVDPVEYGLVVGKGSRLSLPQPVGQEGFICHLGDHDYVLSVPAVKNTLPLIQEIASEDYGLTASDLKRLPFNSLRNRLYSTYSAMRVHEEIVKSGKEGVRNLMHTIVEPV